MRPISVACQAATWKYFDDKSQELGLFSALAACVAARVAYRRMKGPDSVSKLADDLPSALASRRHQMFPQLTDAEIARISRFGTLRRYARGERLFAAARRVRACS
jgi:hypothetical protein